MTSEQQRAYRRKWRAENPEKVRQHARNASDYKKRWWAENKERLHPAKLIKQREYYQENKESINAYSKKWQKEHRLRVRVTQARWVKNNPDKAKKAARDFYLKTMADSQLKLIKNIRIRVSKALSHKCQKTLKNVELLGCSLEDFRIYLESKFEPGMTWENYGSVWHVDHIMPCAIFDLSKLEHQKRCFHFSNQQPLFASDNLVKSDSVITDQFPLL